MFGWFRTPAARASCSKRRSRSGSFENDAGSTLIATSRPRRGSFQAVDDLQVRKDAEIAVGVRLAVGRRHHPVDRGESRSIGGAYLFPGFLAPRGDLVTREPQGDLSLPIEVQPPAFSIESHRYVLGRQAGERRRLAASERVEIDPPVRAPHGGEPAVQRD